MAKESVQSGRASTLRQRSETRIRGYGLLIYGGMMLAGGLLAERRPIFIGIAILGLVALLVGARSLIERSMQLRVAKFKVASKERA